MTGTGEHASQPGDAGLVLVLNSGSSSVKFALVNPGSGHPGTTVALVVPTDEELLIARDTARLVAPVAAAGRDR